MNVRRTPLFFIEGRDRVGRKTKEGEWMAVRYSPNERPPADKVAVNHENPLDAWILARTVRLLPVLRRTGHTPNAITTYSFLCGLASVACLRAGSMIGFVLLYAAAYVFDCLDGQFARHYGMTSAFGDWYDHATDLTVYALVAYTTYERCPPGRVGPGASLALTSAAAVLLVNIGGQQRLHREAQLERGESHEPESLDAFRCLCPRIGWVRWARFGGYATFNVVSVALVVHLLW